MTGNVNWKQYWDEEAGVFVTGDERNKVAGGIVGKGKTVLDVGCGQGEFLDLIKSNNNVFGIDFSENMVKICKRQGFDVRVGSAEGIPFKDSSFDVVVGLGLIEYLESDDKFISECKRVLKSGGLLIVSCRNELFKRWSGRVWHPERRVHNPDVVCFDGFILRDIVLLHEHTPHKDLDKKFYHSEFLFIGVKEEG